MRKYHQIANRYLTKKKANSISVFISIVLSVSILLALTMIIDNIRFTEAEKYVKQFGDYDRNVIGVNQDKLSELDNKEYIDKAYYGQTVGVYNNGLPDENIIEFYGLDKDTFDNMIDFKLIAGRLPKNDKEIILNSQNVSKLESEYKLGDKVNVDLEVNRSFKDYEWFKRYNMVYGKPFSESNPLNGDAMNIRLDKTIIENKEFTVVGIFEVDSENYLWGQRAITMIDKNSLAQGSKVDLYLNTNKSGVEEDLAETFGVRYVKQTLGNNNYGMEASDIKENGYDAIADRKAEQNTGLVLIVIIFCFLVVRNIINISIAQKIKYYGILRAIGANAKQISMLIMKEIFLILIAAIPVGIALGYSFLYGICNIINSILGINYKIVVSMDIGKIAVIVGGIFGICLLASMLVLRKEMRLSPIDAIQDAKGLGDKKVKAKNFLGQDIKDDDEDDAEILNELLTFEETTVKYKIMKTLFGFEGKLGHKNISRDRGRNNSCITSLTTTMIIIIVFLMQGFNGTTVAKYIRSSDNWELKFVNETGPVDESTTNLLESLDGIESVHKDLNTIIQTTIKRDDISDTQFKTAYDNKYEIKHGSTEELNLSVSVKGLDDKSLNMYRDYLLEGELTEESMGEDGVILLSHFTSSYLAGAGIDKIRIFTKYDLRNIFSVGDKIKVDGTDREFEIKAIVSEDVLANNADTHSREKFNRDFEILTTDDVFESLTSMKDSNTVLINTNKEDNAEVIKDIKTKLEGKFFSITDEKELERKAKEEALETLVNNLMYAIILIALVSINLISTLTANIISRKGELAALRAIGMTGKQISKMIVSESVAMVLASLTVVIPVATMFTLVTQFSRGENIAVSNSTVVLMVIGVILVLSILAILISIVPLRIVKKSNIVETLKEDV